MHSSVTRRHGPASCARDSEQRRDSGERWRALASGGRGGSVQRHAIGPCPSFPFPHSFYPFPPVLPPFLHVLPTLSPCHSLPFPLVLPSLSSFSFLLMLNPPPCSFFPVPLSFPPLLLPPSFPLSQPTASPCSHPSPCPHSSLFPHYRRCFSCSFPPFLNPSFSSLTSLPFHASPFPNSPCPSVPWRLALPCRQQRRDVPPFTPLPAIPFPPLLSLPIPLIRPFPFHYDPTVAGVTTSNPLLHRSQLHCFPSPTPLLPFTHPTTSLHPPHHFVSSRTPLFLPTLHSISPSNIFHFFGWCPSLPPSPPAIGGQLHQ
ncbi:unnamed protein product [Closterium sp. Naga37s-1]|nr:unnamed protein product [Closterium sp. Naga37s-1]